jgi:CheY-like chemotaxis protein
MPPFDNPAKRHILIVEDSPDVQSLLSLFLAGEGYEIGFADNGLRALEYLNQQANRLPQVILLDLMMPEMDGFRFRQEQMKIASIAKIPIVVMTADADGQAKAEAVGAHVFLKKPFLDLDTILTAINRFF